MTDLNDYMNDGANKQAQAVLCMVQYFVRDGIESAWNDEFERYFSDISVARFHNCREQGYVISARDYTGKYVKSEFKDKQLNIIFYEHRNSDSIHAVQWVSPFLLNPPTINDPDLLDVWTSKWDTSFSAGFGEIVTMAEWIKEQLELFYTV